MTVEFGNKKKCIFLDRDGVLNVPIYREGRSYPPSSPKGFKLFPGIEKAINHLIEMGFLLVVVTNQPDVSLGRQNKADIEDMHEALRTWLPLGDIFVAWDQDDVYYKPRTGMLEEAVQKFNIDIEKSYMIGDRWRDVDCGILMGCYTIFIDHYYNEMLNMLPNYSCKSFSSAVDCIYNRELGLGRIKGV